MIKFEPQLELGQLFLTKLVVKNVKAGLTDNVKAAFHTEGDWIGYVISNHSKNKRVIFKTRVEDNQLIVCLSLREIVESKGVEINDSIQTSVAQAVDTAFDWLFNS